MKEKLMVCGAIILFIIIIGFLMLVNEGLFGSEIKFTTGMILLVGSIVFPLLLIIFNIYEKFKK